MNFSYSCVKIKLLQKIIKHNFFANIQKKGEMTNFLYLHDRWRKSEWMDYFFKISFIL